MKKSILILLQFIVVISYMSAQTTVIGTVLEMGADSKKQVLPGVNIYWMGTTEGTVSDNNGIFTLERPCPMHRFLVVSYVGYMNDTIDLDQTGNQPEIILNATRTLDEAIINARASGAYISKIDPIYKEVITTHELQKAACCNLAESFETNASVDVSYSDAITGAKQIQLLGLSGIYSQLMVKTYPQ